MGFRCYMTDEAKKPLEGLVKSIIGSFAGKEKLTEEEILAFESLLAILPPGTGSTESAVKMIFGYDPELSDSAIPFWKSR